MLTGYLTINAKSILPHAGNKWIWMLWGENKEKWKRTQYTSGLCRQCSATEPWQPEVHTEDCEGWWLSSCRSPVAEHWRVKQGFLGLTPGSFWLFHFPLLSKFIYWGNPERAPHQRDCMRVYVCLHTYMWPCVTTALAFTKMSSLI